MTALSTPSLSPRPILKFVNREHDDADFTLGKLLSRYCTARPNLSDGSIEQLQVAVNLTTEWLGREVSVAEIFEEEPFERFVWWLSTSLWRGKKRSPATVAGRRASLLTLWDFAFRKRLWPLPMPDRRDLAPLKVPDEDPTSWWPEEWDLILATARTAPAIRHWTPDHWLTMLDCFWRSAERLTGMLQCELTDIDNDVLNIRAEYTKDKKAGILKLGPALADTLRRLERRAGCLKIWDFPGCEETLRNHYRNDILIPAKLPHDRKHLFHCIRRTSVTEVVNLSHGDEKKGQEHARHTSGKVTKKYISRAKLRGKKLTSDLLPSLIGQKQQLLFK